MNNIWIVGVILKIIYFTPIKTAPMSPLNTDRVWLTGGSLYATHLTPMNYKYTRQSCITTCARYD